MATVAKSGFTIEGFVKFIEKDWGREIHDDIMKGDQKSMGKIDPVEHREKSVREWWSPVIMTYECKFIWISMEVKYCNSYPCRAKVKVNPEVSTQMT